jgi:hypothetical protein
VAVNQPNLVVKVENGELLAVVYTRSDKLLVAVYKKETDDGFVVTTFFTSSVNSLLKREIMWQK